MARILAARRCGRRPLLWRCALSRFRGSIGDSLLHYSNNPSSPNATSAVRPSRAGLRPLPTGGTIVRVAHAEFRARHCLGGDLAAVAVGRARANDRGAAIRVGRGSEGCWGFVVQRTASLVWLNLRHATACHATACACACARCFVCGLRSPLVTSASILGPPACRRRGCVFLTGAVSFVPSMARLGRRKPGYVHGPAMPRRVPTWGTADALARTIRAWIIGSASGYRRWTEAVYTSCGGRAWECCALAAAAHPTALQHKRAGQSAYAGSGCDWFVWDCRALPFPNGSVDAIVSGDGRL